MHSYTQNGLLHMLDRNRRIKLKPEKFQHCEEQFDLIITCEERVYDQVVECTHPSDVIENAFNEFFVPSLSGIYF